MWNLLKVGDAMKEYFLDLSKDTKKLGRIITLIIILGITGTISIVIVLKGDQVASINVLEDWIKLVGITVVFYFVSAKNENGD